MTTLQRVITLSARCVAAVDAKDYRAAGQLMRTRDQLYLELDTSDALTFRAWANDKLTDDEIAALLAATSSPVARCATHCSNLRG